MAETLLERYAGLLRGRRIEWGCLLTDEVRTIRAEALAIGDKTLARKASQVLVRRRRPGSDRAYAALCEAAVARHHPAAQEEEEV